MNTRGNAVVVGLDSSDQGRAAVDHAAALAIRRGLHLRVVHAFEASGSERHDAERLLGQTVEVIKRVYPTLVVESRLEPSSAVGTLVEESRGAHVVVMGARGTGGFVNLVIGSTTLHVASQAHCPVIAVPAPGEQARHGVVVGVDTSALSQHAIDFALHEASDLAEPLTAVHAYEDPARLGREIMLPLVQLELVESMAGWAEKYPDVAITQKVVRDHAVHALVREAAHASLLVVGSRGHGAVRSLLGSVSHGVLHHASGPVAVVHHED